MPALRVLFLLLCLTWLAPPFALAVTAVPHHAPETAQHKASERHDKRCAEHASTGLELDCSTCHAHGAALLLADGVTPWLALRNAPTRTTEHGHAPPWHARPYRPQWAALPAQG